MLCAMRASHAKGGHRMLPLDPRQEGRPAVLVATVARDGAALAQHRLDDPVLLRPPDNIIFLVE